MFEERTIEALTIEDESSFRHVGLYSELKNILKAAKYRFRVLPAASEGRWDRALFLNLTFWGGDGGDVLVDSNIPADVVAHVAWHHLATRALGTPLGPAGLFLGESIASAFDVYLVGRLLGHSPKSTFLGSQVPAMADSAAAAGLDDDAFDALLQGIADDPDRAFEDLRHLLFTATCALYECTGGAAALKALSTFDTHRFAPLLHHYELSNWVLYARAYAKTVDSDEKARAVDAELQRAPVALDWLSKAWMTP